MQARSTFVAPKACAVMVLLCAALEAPAARAEPPSKPASPLRLPGFLALGVGGLTAGGAVVAGVAGSSHADQKLDCGSHCGAPTDRALSTTSKVLAGVAAASVGVGLVFLLTAPSRAERPSFAPSLGLGVSATKATAKAVWTF
jgi:hypothetical protein